MSAEIPVKYKLPVEKFRPAVKERPAAVEPTFKIGDVQYFDRLPQQPAEKPRQTLLPISLVGDWARDYIKVWNATHPPEEHKYIRWKADESGLQDPNFGSVQHYATVNYDVYPPSMNLQKVDIF